MGDILWACWIFQRLNPSYQQSLQVMVKVESVSESFEGVGDQILRWGKNPLYLHRWVTIFFNHPKCIPFQDIPSSIPSIP